MSNVQASLEEYRGVREELERAVLPLATSDYVPLAETRADADAAALERFAPLADAGWA